MRIRLAQCDIDRASVGACDGKQCPIALALQRHGFRNPDVQPLYVEIDGVCVANRGWRVEYTRNGDLKRDEFFLPPSACDFAEAFDNREWPQPISFLILPVQP